MTSHMVQILLIHGIPENFHKYYPNKISTRQSGQTHPGKQTSQHRSMLWVWTYTRGDQMVYQRKPVSTGQCCGCGHIPEVTKWSIKDVVVCRTVYGRMHLKHSLESVNDLSAELSMVACTLNTHWSLSMIYQQNCLWSHAP